MTDEELNTALTAMQDFAKRAEADADRAEAAEKNAAGHSSTAEEAAGKSEFHAQESAKSQLAAASRNAPAVPEGPKVPQKEPKLAAADSIIGMYFNIDEADARAKYIKPKDDAQRIAWAKEIVNKVRNNNHSIALQILNLEKQLNG